MNDLFQFDMKVKLKMIVIMLSLCFLFYDQSYKTPFANISVCTTDPTHWMQFLCCCRRKDMMSLCVMSQINAVVHRIRSGLAFILKTATTE